MAVYDKVVLDTFLKNQLQLYPEIVAEDEEEADEFLDICMAVVCKDIKDVKKYLKEVGVDIAGMTEQDIREAQEVFALPDGRFLVVEA